MEHREPQFRFNSRGESYLRFVLRAAFGFAAAFVVFAFAFFIGFFFAIGMWE